jgi:hypothetical protein
MRKGKRLVNTTGDVNREKLEETVKAAEAMIALLKQFGIPVNSNWIRAINKARMHLDESKSIS